MCPNSNFESCHLILLQSSSYFLSTSELTLWNRVQRPVEAASLVSDGFTDIEMIICAAALTIAGQSTVKILRGEIKMLLCGFFIILSLGHSVLAGWLAVWAHCLSMIGCLWWCFLSLGPEWGEARCSLVKKTNKQFLLVFSLSPHSLYKGREVLAHRTSAQIEVRQSWECHQTLMS